jgi:hypothetical protein
MLVSFSLCLSTCLSLCLCLSVCLSVCSHWTDFHEIWYLRIFRKFVEKSQVLVKFYKNILTEVFPCFFFSCKANARVILAKNGHGSHTSKLVFVLMLLVLLFYGNFILFYVILYYSMYYFLLFYVSFVCICVQTTAISTSIFYMKTNTHYWAHLAQSFLERKMFQTKVVENIETHVILNNVFFL